MRSFRSCRLIAALGAAVMLAGAACTPADSTSLSIGVRRVSLDLTLRNDTERVKAPPAPAIPPSFRGNPPPQVLIPDGTPPRAEPPIGVSLCPPAPPGAVPPEPAPLAFRGAPVPGPYQNVNDGTVRLEAGPLSVALPMPALTPLSVSGVTPVPVSEPLGNPRTDYRFDVEETLFPHSTATRLEITKDPGQRSVVRILAMSVTVGGNEVFQFRPVTPVAWIVIDPNLDQWTSAGVDYATGSVMTIEGRNAGRARVELCGEIHEGWELEVRQRLANINSRFTMDDQSGRVSRVFVAPQLGGLVLARETHATMTVPGEIPLIYTLDWSGHLVAPEPAT